MANVKKDTAVDLVQFTEEFAITFEALQLLLQARRPLAIIGSHGGIKILKFVSKKTQMENFKCFLAQQEIQYLEINCSQCAILCEICSICSKVRPRITS
jgi:hypothetical protein